MKDEFSLNDKEEKSTSDFRNSYEEDEIGIAVNESGDSKKAKKSDVDEYDEDYSSDIEADEEQTGSHLAYAESSKDRLVDKVKGNLVYIFIALILIVPGAMKLYDMFSAPTAQPQIERMIGFEETPTSDDLGELVAMGSAPATQSEEAPAQSPAEPATPAEPVADTDKTTPAEAAAAETTTKPQQESTNPEATTSQPENAAAAQVPEDVPTPPVQAENAARSFLSNLLGDGSGSETKSGSLTQETAPATDNAPNQMPSIAQAGAAKTPEQAWAELAQQESEVEQKLTSLLDRMQKIDERLALLDDMDERLDELEDTENAQSADELKQVLDRMSQVEKGVTQLRQQQAQPVAPQQVTTSPAIKKEGESAAPVNPGIIVEAVIPGRAWLRNQQGVLMVVEVGDEIPQVGKVTRIDAREGLVATATHTFRQ